MNPANLSVQQEMAKGGGKEKPTGMRKSKSLDKWGGKPVRGGGTQKGRVTGCKIGGVKKKNKGGHGRVNQYTLISAVRLLVS